MDKKGLEEREGGQVKIQSESCSARGASLLAVLDLLLFARGADGAKEPGLLDDLAESSKEYHQSRIRSLLRTPVSFHLTPLYSLLTSHASPNCLRESPLLFKMRTAWGI